MRMDCALAIQSQLFESLRGQGAEMPRLTPNSGEREEKNSHDSAAQMRDQPLAGRILPPTS